MNPRLVRDLVREGDAIVAMIDGIPAGRQYDMAGHIDAKRAAKTALRIFLVKLRNDLPCGEPAKPLFAGQSGRPIFPVATARRRA